MRLAHVARLGVVAMVAGLLVPGTSAATEPSSGTLTAESGPVAWTGGPFEASNRAVCAGPTDPTCDHFLLTVDAPVGRVVQVAVAAGDPDEIYNFTVHAPDGRQVAASGWGDTVVVNFTHHRFFPEGPYEIRVQPNAVAAGSTYQGMARLSETMPDPKDDCLEAVPPMAGVRGVTDDGSVLRLRLLVLLDQWGRRGHPASPALDEETGRKIVEDAAVSYAPLGIELTARFEEIHATSAEVDDLFAAAKEHVGGSRPDDVDIVYLMTRKNITRDGSSSVAGVADCIGGLEDPRRAFVIGQTIEPFELGTLWFSLYGSAKVLAHEVGHLLGAHHHYANCVEGVPDELDEGGVTPCTLMAPDLTLLSRTIGVGNTAVMRARVWAYARG